MINKDLLKKFCVDKTKQAILKIGMAIYKKPGYTQVNADEMLKYLNFQDQLDNLEEEMNKYLIENEDFFLREDLANLLKDYIVSKSEQRKLVKELLGIEKSIDELIEMVD